MDFETMLLDAMKQGKSLEDVMKDVSTAANKIEKEQKAANKYDIYEKPVRLSFASDISALDSIIRKDKLHVRDVAIVIAHFMCQNVPGYAKALAKNGTDPIDLYQKMLEGQKRTAKVLAEHQNDTAEDRSKALFDHLFSEVLDGVLDKITKDENASPAAKSIFCGTVTDNSDGCITAKSDADAEKMVKFLKDMGLA